MIRKSIPIPEAQATLADDWHYRAIPSDDEYLSWREQLIGVAWSIGFRLAWVLVVVAVAPNKLLTKNSEPQQEFSVGD